MRTNTYHFVVVYEKENPDAEEFEWFAYEEDDYDWMMYEGGYGARGNLGPFPTRGVGNTPTEAIACLCALLHEEAEDKDTEEEHKPWVISEARKLFIGR